MNHEDAKDAKGREEDAERWKEEGDRKFYAGDYTGAIEFYDKAVTIKPDFHQAWYNRSTSLYNLERYEDAIASFDKAVAIKPDYLVAWYNRGTILCDRLQMYEEAIASFDKVIEIQPDFQEAWRSRGIAAGRSVSFAPLLSSISNIAKQNPHLNLRGYEGKLASCKEGLKHCLQDTHPEGWGILHHAIGDAHYFQGLSASHPRSYRNKAANSYNQALITLTATDFPEQHLEVLRDLIRVRLDLGDTAKAEELRRQGTDVLRRSNDH